MIWVHSLELLIYFLTIKNGRWQNKELMFQYSLLHKHKTRAKKLRGLSLQANYADRATAACRRS
jgi:hypothetical protein